MNGKRLYRSEDNAILCGVCAGFAEYFGLDPSLVRMGWALASLLTAGVAIPIYIVGAIVLPKEQDI